MWLVGHSISGRGRLLWPVSTRGASTERQACRFELRWGKKANAANQLRIGQRMTRMKKLLLTTAAITALAAGSANAADMRVKAPLPPPPPACAQFGGFYAGANVGWGYGDHTLRSLDNIAGRF